MTQAPDDSRRRRATDVLAGQLLGPPLPASQVGHARLRVMAYDIHQPRRAARVRRLLRRWAAGDGQYSVCEVQLGAADLHALTGAVHDRLDIAVDKLAIWQPARQLAWRLHAASAPAELARWPAFRHWMMAYDIRDPGRLARVQRLVAAHCVAVQRSVYVLHGSEIAARAVARGAVALLDDDDRLAVWPLLSAAHLWVAQPEPPACFVIAQPVAEHLGQAGAATRMGWRDE